MSYPASSTDDLIIEFAERPERCVVTGCGGLIVRHSLGGGQAVHRCTRCFRRYEARASADAPAKGRLRRMLDDFVTWRE